MRTREFERIAVFFDKPTRAQGLQVAAHSGEGDLRGLCELTRAPRPFAQEINDAPAMGIRECRERAIKIAGVHVGFANLSPLAFSISSWETCLIDCEKVQ